jgi:hypothetical protein
MMHTVAMSVLEKELDKVRHVLDLSILAFRQVENRTNGVLKHGDKIFDFNVIMMEESTIGRIAKPDQMLLTNYKYLDRENPYEDIVQLLFELKGMELEYITLTKNELKKLKRIGQP